jgi:ATP-binding cassette subfamily B protein
MKIWKCMKMKKFEKETNDEKVKEAARDAKAEEFILSNKKGYEEPIGRDFNGVDFSGGQHQRIALARTFYRDSGLVIMDEPTSAVDAKAESEIFETIKEKIKSKTVIFISHRFSTVRMADRILVIDKGKITEEGTHEKLLNNNGLYSTMFKLQAKGYE